MALAVLPIVSSGVAAQPDVLAMLALAMTDKSKPRIEPDGIIMSHLQFLGRAVPATRFSAPLDAVLEQIGRFFGAFAKNSRLNRGLCDSNSFRRS